MPPLGWGAMQQETKRRLRAGKSATAMSGKDHYPALPAPAACWPPRGPLSHLPLMSCYGRLVTLAERLSVMRAVTSLMIVCLSACGTSPAPEQAWDEQDNRGGQQAQLDAQAIMAGMDQARIRAALLARTGR